MLQASPCLICFLIWLQNALSLIVSCLPPWLLSLFVIADNSSSSSVAWGKWLAKQDSYSSRVVQANMFSELLFIFLSPFGLFLPSPPSDLFFRGSAFILDSNWVPCYHFSEHHVLHFYFSFVFSFIYLFILLYNIVLVLPCIDMTPPQLYTCSPSWTPPPTSLPVPSLWVIPVHQSQASCIMHWTWMFQ